MDAPVPETEDMQVDRDAIISAANVLMVALLKMMNRVLIPALLKWGRTAHMSWICAADHDIRQDGTKKRSHSLIDHMEDEETLHDEEEHKTHVDRERFRRATAVNLLLYT